MLTRHLSKLSDRYRHASKLVCCGEYGKAREALCDIQRNPTAEEPIAVVLNDLAVLQALDGGFEIAQDGFLRSLVIDRECKSAWSNLEQLAAFLKSAKSNRAAPAKVGKRRIRIAIVSLLFNWPSTGGGTIHTFEAAKFLSAAGYDVRQIYARQDEWGLGRVTDPLAVDSEELVFESADWNPETIRNRFREAVDSFSPDFVIVTDSWNTKPLLAEAVSAYRIF